MKQCIPYGLFVVLLFGANAAHAVAQSAEQPQIAFRILDDYERNRALRDTVVRDRVGVGLIAGGAVIDGGAALLAFDGSSLFAESNGADLRVSAAAAWGAVGLIVIGSGIWTLASQPADYHQTLSLVYSEKDPVVQEALAAGTLKALSQKGRDRRIRQGIVQIALPLIASFAVMAANSAANRGLTTGFDDTSYDIAMSTIFVAGGIKVFQSSPEELLYGKYLAARDALYSTPGSGD